MEARFIPRQYEPNYAYPLLVLLHARGGDEEQLVRAMPALSWRNYVGLGLRGPEPVTKRDRLVGFGWGAEFEQPERRRARRSRPLSEAEIVRRVLFDPEPEAFDRLEEAVFTAILQTRRLLHVHSERIFLVGCGEGAAVAYWLGLSFPERFAGVVAINGWLPGRPAAAGPAQSLSRPARSWSCTGPGTPRSPCTTRGRTSRRSAPAACESPSSPIPAPTA